MTHFRVIGRAPGFTLARVQLETGRTHQIRVHFAALGHAVAGDAQYGGGRGRRAWAASSCTPPGWAWRILTDVRPLEFASPLPPDLADFAGEAHRAASPAQPSRDLGGSSGLLLGVRLLWSGDL